MGSTARSRLSKAAYFSRIWLAIAAGIAVFGGPDGPAAAIAWSRRRGVTFGDGDLVAKSRAPASAPGPASAHFQLSGWYDGGLAAFPSGHLRSAFAFRSRPAAWARPPRT